MTCCSTPGVTSWSSTSKHPRLRAFTSGATACSRPRLARRSKGRGWGRSARNSPNRPSQLFVSNAHNGGLAGTVSAFLVARSGQLAAIGASPFGDLQEAPCWVEISQDGQFLFAVNTGSGSISRYSINPDGSLVLLGSTPFGAAGREPLTSACPPTARRCSWTAARPGDRLVRGQRRRTHPARDLTDGSARRCIRRGTRWSRLEPRGRPGPGGHPGPGRRPRLRRANGMDSHPNVPFRLSGRGSARSR